MTTSAAAVEHGNHLAEGGILDRIIAETRLTPDDEGLRHRQARRIGLHRGTAQATERKRAGEEGNGRPHDRGDRRQAQPADGRNPSPPTVRALESSRRGLKLLVDRTNFRENIKLELLNASKQDLLDDFEDSPEIVSPACTSTSTRPSTASSVASRSVR